MKLPALTHRCLCFFQSAFWHSRLEVGVGGGKGGGWWVGAKAEVREVKLVEI